VLFLSFNGHLILLSALVKSFAVVPVAVGAAVPMSGLAALANAGAMLFEIGVFLALPVVAVVLTMHLAVGTLSRAAPQINLMSVGFSLFIWIGLAATITLVPLFAPAVEHMIDAGLALMAQVIRAPSP
jgi:flagellar biosynthetic protein FliR